MRSGMSRLRRWCRVSRYKTAGAIEMAVKAPARKLPMDTNAAIDGFYFHRLLVRIFDGGSTK